MGRPKLKAGVRYPTTPERILLSGLGAVPKRIRTCASDRRKYKNLRLNPCVEYFEVDESAEPICSSRDIDTLFHNTFDIGATVQESLYTACLDSRNKVIGVSEMFKGSGNEAAVDTTLVLQTGVLVGAVSIIVVHNHPTGEYAPSDADVALTKRIQQAAKLVGLNLLDHVIVTHKRGKYFSFTDAGLLS